MASDDTSQDVPSIAPPSLGFGRRRRKKGAEPEPAPVAEPLADPVALPLAEPEEASTPSEAPAPAPEPVNLEPAGGGHARTIFDLATGPDATTAPMPTPAPVAGPDLQPEPPPVPEPDPGPELDAVAPADAEQTQVIPAAADATSTRSALIPGFEPIAVPVEPATEAEKPRRRPRVRRPRAAPRNRSQARAPRTLAAPAWLDGRVAAMVTGLVVGLLIVIATALSLRLCDLVQGTTSCGKPGSFLLVAILVLGVVAGSLMLRLAKVADPGSTSFLAVALMSVAALLFLIDQLFAWWMVIAVPLISVGTFALSHWVTTTFTEGARD